MLSVKLSDLVDFVDDRKVQRYRPGVSFLSVLHIISEGVLDFKGIKAYAPKTPGVPVNPGEVLLSRINPRIPRSIVVPELGCPILCSSEFEIMRPKKGVDPYMIAFLVLSVVAQTQIQSLTSGTSASHNRVKTRDLAHVSLPIPRSGSEPAKRLRIILATYQKVLAGMTECQKQLSDLRDNETHWMQPMPAHSA
jgi:hypothetical protein